MKYKIFLISWAIKSNLPEVAEELQKRYCDILYWTGRRGDPPLDRNRFPGAIFQRSPEALKAYPAENMDVSILEPPGKDVIEALFECESTALSMMDAADYSHITFRARKRLYYKLLSYWYGILKLKKPDAIVFGFSPHTLFDYILYSLAKFFRIKTIILLETPVTSDDRSIRLLITNDIKKEPAGLIKELKNTKNIKLEDLSKDVRDYYIARSSSGKNFQLPPSSQSVLGRKRATIFYLPQIRNVFIGIIEGSLLSRTRKYLYNIFFKKSGLFTLSDNFTGLEYEKKLWEWRRIKRGFKKEYEGLQSGVNWEKKFIFVALHYQPERTTCPDGGVFYDQLLMVDILSHSVPKDWVVYVKEHPFQWVSEIRNTHLGRYKGYYKEIASLKNVFLVPANIFPNKFVERCQAVATVTGTIALEAIFSGKPALVFGYPWYKECSEICMVSDVSSCQKAIEKLRNGHKPDKQKVLNYFGAFDRGSVTARISRDTGEIPIDSRQENIKNIADAIYYELQRD